MNYTILTILVSTIISLPTLKGIKNQMYRLNSETKYIQSDSVTQVSKIPTNLKILESMDVTFPIQETDVQLRPILPPFLGKSLIGFKEALAFKESGGNYFAINTLGYMGKYQFGTLTLDHIGVKDADEFLSDPSLQEKVFLTYLSMNKWLLRNEIDVLFNIDIAGLEITESGILAAAHLAGAGNVKKYLRTRGTVDVQDAYGTKVSHYIMMFSGFDLSQILPRKTPGI